MMVLFFSLRRTPYSSWGCERNYLTGFVEEVDLRRAGARFVLRVASAEGLPGDAAPARVRLTTRGEPNFK
ncbi:MAG TPA: hypothetical protein VIF02_01835, partial [Methylocella sp.]